MKNLYTLLLIGIAAISLIACQGEGDFYAYTPYVYSPSSSSNGTSASSIKVSGLSNPFLFANNIDMIGAIEMRTEGNSVITIDKLCPNSFYYVANMTEDEFGGKTISYPAMIRTKDYDTRVSVFSNTQVTFDMGTVNYDKLLIGSNATMDDAIPVELHDDTEHGGKEVWYMRPNTTYYWVTEATDIFGETYRSPVKSFTTHNWDMYLEYVTTSEIMFNAGSVYYTKWCISDKPDMSTILATETSWRFRISGMKPNTTYYYQTEATDLFGNVYKSPVFQFKTLEYEVETLQPDVTSSTARLKAQIKGTTTGHNISVRFSVYENNSFYFSGSGIYDSATDTYYCDIAVMSNSSNYTVKATAVENGSDYSTGKTLDFTLDSHHAAEAVDMGLSVNWASWNVGARSPEEYGGLYYYGDKYAYINVGAYGEQQSISGTYRDIAKQFWGGSWRMPTYKEFTELKENSTISSDVLNGVAGYRITSTKNGNSIFIPCAGTRPNGSRQAVGQGSVAQLYSGSASEYPRWVDDQYGNSHYGDYQVWYFYLSDSYLSSGIGINDYQIGRSIRPVYPKN